MRDEAMLCLGTVDSVDPIHRSPPFSTANPSSSHDSMRERETALECPPTIIPNTLLLPLNETGQKSRDRQLEESVYGQGGGRAAI